MALGHKAHMTNRFSYPKCQCAYEIVLMRLMACDPSRDPLASILTETVRVKTEELGEDEVWKDAKANRLLS